MLLGSHLSIAGGMYRALDKAHGYGFDCVAMFVRNQVQWKASPLAAAAVERFRARRAELSIGPVVAHGSYLVNLAGRAEIRRKSIAAMREDVARCDRLGIEFLVFHPGSNENEATGIRLIAESLNQIVSAARPANVEGPSPTVLLETTAGQGNCIGHRFEQLAGILAKLEQPERFGICLDTCHVFAAGYDIRTPAAYRKTMKALNEAVGLDRLRAIHLNDSKRGLGSHVDRHNHIGHGEIRLAGFASLVNDRRLAKIPMILETPKGRDEKGRDWDEINAAALRSLVKSRRRSSL